MGTGDDERIRAIAARARGASRVVSSLSAETKNGVLLTLRDLLGSRGDEVLRANAEDIAAATDAGVDAPKLKRLRLDASGVAQLRESLAQIAAMEDPVGAVTEERRVESGLLVRRIRAALGVVAMIYEARPGVTVDAFALCFKSGNVCVLKGGREAARTNGVLAGLIHEALDAHGVTRDAAHSVSDLSREGVREMLTLSDHIDLVIPRGGESLIRFVHEHARIPTVLHFKGVCHIYVDEDADLDRALEIVATAKTSNPATCNTVECVLIHDAVADAFVPMLLSKLSELGVELRGDERVCTLAPGAVRATDGDWGREYLDLVLAARVVGSMDEAIGHIAAFGSDHTEAILTSDEARAREFTARVQSSCVLVNASTRFNDGFELGLGAEIGISTSKIHAYGPMGLEGLTTQRYVVLGDGQTR